MSFFTRVMGFDEEEYGATQQRLLQAATFRETRGVAGQVKEYCEINGQGGVPVSCGWFSTPSVRELHIEVHHALGDRRVRAAFAAGSLVGASQNGNLTIQNIPGESNLMHSDPNLIFSTVQAASQFNTLEFPNQYVTPEDGISDYEHDHTQGPACAIACAAGTVYRNYLCRAEDSPAGVRGQTHDRQFNALQGVEDILRQKHQVADPWVVKNGYIESTDQVLTNPTMTRVFGEPANRRELVEALRIGVHEDVQVTNVGAGCVRGEAGEMVLDTRLARYGVPHQMVTQTYNSAVSIGYSAASSSAWKPLATMVLDATYEATLLVGILNAAKHAAEHGVVPSILLTKVGGGVFQNDQAWIQSAIVQGCRNITNKYGALPINVKIVHYGQVERGYEPLEGRSFEVFPPWLMELPMSDEHRELFRSESIDEDAFLLLRNENLKALGLKTGPRKRLLTEIARRQPSSPDGHLLVAADIERMSRESSAVIGDATPESMPVTPHQVPPFPSASQQTTTGAMVQPSPLTSEAPKLPNKTPPTATMSRESSFDLVNSGGGEETVANNPTSEWALVKQKKDGTVTVVSEDKITLTPPASDLVAPGGEGLRTPPTAATLDPAGATQQQPLVAPMAPWTPEKVKPGEAPQDAPQEALATAGGGGTVTASAFPQWLLDLPVGDNIRQVLHSELIDETTFYELEEPDLEKLGLKMGPRKTLLRVIGAKKKKAGT